MAKTAAEVYEERGRRVGEIEGRRHVLVHQMRQKFGALPEATVTKVKSIQTVEELDRLSELILTASSLEEMVRLGGGHD